MTSTRELLVVTIETLTDNSFDVIIDKRAKISDLKVRLYQMTGVETHQQRILLGYVELNDMKSLEHYRIKIGSKLKMYPDPKGGLVQYHSPSPVPPLINLETFLKNAAEAKKSPPKSTTRDSGESDHKKTHSAFYVVHDGIPIKIKEFVSKHAEEDAKEYFRKLSKYTIEARNLLVPTKSTTLLENERLKDRMKEVRKNVEDNTLVLRELLQKRKLSRPVIPKLPPMETDRKRSLSFASKFRSLSLKSRQEMLRISRMYEDRAKEKEKVKEERMAIEEMRKKYEDRRGEELFEYDERDESDDEIYDKNKVREEVRRLEKLEKKELDEKKRTRELSIASQSIKSRSKKKDSKKSQPEIKPIHELIKITPVRLVDKPSSTRRVPFSTEIQESSQFPSVITTDTSRTSKHTTFKEVDRSPSRSGIRFSDYSANNENETKPIYTPGLYGAEYERYINSDEFRNEVKARDTMRVKREIASTFKEGGVLDREMKEGQKHKGGMNDAYFDSLIALMAQTFGRKSDQSQKRLSNPFSIRTVTADLIRSKYSDAKLESDSISDQFMTNKFQLSSGAFSKRGKDRPLGMVTVERCEICNKKMGIFDAHYCECKRWVCQLHKHPNDHNCSYYSLKGASEKHKLETSLLIGH